MEQHIKELFRKNQYPPELSLQEVLDIYKDIELSEDEYRIAIIEAKRKKQALLKKIEIEKRAEENRKLLTSRYWSFDQTKKYMLYRAGIMFNGEFEMDQHNEIIFDMLCHYFSNEKEFEKLAAGLGVKNPSLEKGILLAGNFGVGKTWLMSLFRKNNRQVYHVEHAKELAKSFHKGGEEAIERHYHRIKNAFNDPTVLYQEYSGLCIEDIGREDVKNSYGNKTNVVGDIMEARYINKCMGLFFHGTTNFTVAQLEQFYGRMLVDRFREHLNLIELGGPSRRK